MCVIVCVGLLLWWVCGGQEACGLDEMMGSLRVMQVDVGQRVGR